LLLLLLLPLLLLLKQLLPPLQHLQVTWHTSHPRPCSCPGSRGTVPEIAVVSRCSAAFRQWRAVAVVRVLQGLQGRRCLLCALLVHSLGRQGMGKCRGKLGRRHGLCNSARVLYLLLLGRCCGDHAAIGRIRREEQGL
jgi:hypothetical protein